MLFKKIIYLNKFQSFIFSILNLIKKEFIILYNYIIQKLFLRFKVL